MKRVKILQAIDGHEVGDTPEVTGDKVREYLASGHAERIDEPEAKATHASHSSAKRPKR